MKKVKQPERSQLNSLPRSLLIMDHIVLEPLPLFRLTCDDLVAEQGANLLESLSGRLGKEKEVKDGGGEVGGDEEGVVPVGL